MWEHSTILQEPKAVAVDGHLILRTFHGHLAAKAKLVGLLAQRLKGNGIYVGEVTIARAIKGTPTENVKGATVADKFWELYRARDEVRARVSQ